ncbi:hypothetical protein KAR28_03065 [Candidatus Parcubacteria bacterium]|nr:hypothetical protein [Candidatus Parcubacteria bacterium]
MKLNYEKHQRDYTVLASIVIAEEFYSKRMCEFFSYKPHPFYFLVKDKVFYHFLPAQDYAGWANAYFNKYTGNDYAKYVKKMDKPLSGYRKFFKQNHKNEIVALEILHDYMQIFMPIIMVSVYAPDFVHGLDKKIYNLCIKTREKYEDVHKCGMELQKKLLNRPEKKRGLKKDILKYLTFNEYKQFLKTNILPRGVEDRKNYFFYKCSVSGGEIIPKRRAKAILDKIDQTNNIDKNIKLIKGNSAFLGKARGKVRIIRLIKESNKFKEGEVLVASMTDPRYLPAMKRAVAFVTDEGGITCHAAIVARELKKPCIIGTKIATKILRDGDLVEVDADKGVVKILKKK